MQMCFSFSSVNFCPKNRIVTLLHVYLEIHDFMIIRMMKYCNFLFLKPQNNEKINFFF
jgi:hypothetical protein